MAVKPVGTLVVERILFRNLCPSIKTKLSDKVASCSFAAPFSVYFVTKGFMNMEKVLNCIIADDVVLEEVTLCH